MYKVAHLLVYTLFFLTSVFAELPSHSDITLEQESVGLESPPSNTTGSDFQIIIPPVSEQYTIVSESALSSVTEVARLLQNALLSAISTPSETQTSQQLYILQLVESTLGQLVVSEPLRELLFSHAQTLLNLFKDQPPKLENLALTMVSCPVFGKSFWGSDLTTTEYIEQFRVYTKPAPAFRNYGVKTAYQFTKQLPKTTDTGKSGLHRNPDRGKSYTSQRNCRTSSGIFEKFESEQTTG